MRTALSDGKNQASLFVLCSALCALLSCANTELLVIDDGREAVDSGVGGHGGAGKGGAGGSSSADASSEGGTSGTGGASGAGAGGNSDDAAGERRDAAPPSLCAFASGLNVAWVKFANDVPNPDISAFNTIFRNTYDAGGRVIRWWFHTNGTVTPGYDASGLALPISTSHIDGVRSILNAASTNQVKLVVSLWSFDMLQSNAGEAHTNNALLLENDAHRQAYIDNVLTPLVNALKDHPGLYAWEIFNEPEGMGPKGWATYRTTMAAIQRTVNWLSSAIRSADPRALITTSAQTFDYCSNVAGKTNYYSDSALRAAGGRQNGTIDFYQVHYYAVNGISNSAFLHPASYWGLDKNVVLGEFASIDNDGVSSASAYTYLYDNGYTGAWAWAYNSDWPWPSMQEPMRNVHRAHPNEVGSCTSTTPREVLGSAGSSGVRARAAASPAFIDESARAAAAIRALAARGALSDARAQAERMVNDLPDSEYVREIERFTGAHRHRNIRVGESGVLETF